MQTGRFCFKQLDLNYEIVITIRFSWADLMENTGASKIVLILGGVSRDQLIERRLRKFVQSKERLKKSFCEVDLIFMPSRTLSAFLPFSYKWYSGFPGEGLRVLQLGNSFVAKYNKPEECADPFVSRNNRYIATS